ncbi:Fe-containing alcohol dehydrogenase [Mycena chlorophos]|uniref:Fe-containing alcohol dehydrogenase n=1 Tax=Mycena chlorophos TaxID=658473 RepID=A0A8H6SMI3_MYCCL|nr:Fe-containing alcohol dehydrogenase [Mycena chlorophos]
METYRLAVPTSQNPSTIQSNHPNPLEGTFNNTHITYGLPFQEAAAKHLVSTFDASRVYILASRTLATRFSALQDLKDALGAKVVGVKIGLKAHTSWDEVLEMKQECVELNVDAIVTLGGGSLTDAAKLLTLVLANEVHTPADFRTTLNILLPNQLSTAAFTAHPPQIPVICIPTTLSGGEYTHIAGATEDATASKYQFMAGHGIRLLILDGALCARTTPVRLWLASGFRAVDHCVEAFVSTLANRVTEEHAVKGLRMIVPALLRVKAEAAADTEGKDVDVDARVQAQLGVIEGVAATLRVYTPIGASHAIGHMLGPFGVSHGETSAVLLPAVCAFNAKHGGDSVTQRQAALAKVLRGIPEFKAAAAGPGVALQEGASLAELLRALTKALGLPTTLKEVGIEGAEVVQKLAEQSLLDPWMLENPVPISTKEQVLELLEPIVG